MQAQANLSTVPLAEVYKRLGRPNPSIALTVSRLHERGNAYSYAGVYNVVRGRVTFNAAVAEVFLEVAAELLAKHEALAAKARQLAA